ncbi:hypothetical protein [Spirosoma validum]|uniref:HTH domain-containing protein n=1 Tax=Spirosoma validum TaxID=2771355 RepID=A0A927B1J5_9BACT|nr:hypothetical protein [Spirosoma validum]MBD2753718.1 hypothetical protein [Spirosoma validum]
MAPVLTPKQQKRQKLYSKLYSQYQKLLATGSKATAIEHALAKQYKVSQSTVQRVVQAQRQ